MNSSNDSNSNDINSKELIKYIQTELFEIKEHIPDGKYVELMNKFQDMYKQSENEIKPYVMNVEYIERKEDDNGRDFNRKQDILLMLKVKDFEEIKQKTPYLYRWNGHKAKDDFFSLGYNTFANYQLKEHNYYEAYCEDCESYKNCSVSRVYMIKHIKPHYEIGQPWI